jgi:NTE family protein
MRIFIALLLASLAAGCATPPPAQPPQEPLPKPAPKVALALGGGAARGFAHIGVIKALEAQGIRPDIVTGTSAGSVIGALYAGGFSGFQMQKLAMEVEESTFTDWSLPDRGLIRGEALQDFINKSVQNRPLERLQRPLGVVATDLASGQKVVFRTGNTGMAVRASSAVPGVFKPIRINGKEYVDGGLTSPVPVQAAKAMGADIVIAVDIGNRPEWSKTDSTLEVLLQTFTIMGNAISRQEMRDADVVIRPDTAKVNATDFEGRHLAILEGEKAAAAVMPALKKRLAEASAH